MVGLLAAMKRVVNSLPARWLMLAALAVSVGCPRPASADTGAAAEGLFLDGRRLMDEGRYPEACRRFEDSQRLEPAVGTALNLARCYALTQRTASAWTRYHEAAALANVANQREREQAALAAAAALEPSLAKLILKHEHPQPGLSIELDGSLAPESLFFVATPVDPAEHEVVVSRHAKVLWRTTVRATPGQVVEVAIPGFAAEALPQARETPPSQGSRRLASTAAVASQDAGLTGVRRTAVIGLVATSALAVAYAAVEALRARDAYQDSEEGCDQASRCNAAGLAHRDLAFERARRADVSLVVAGGAALGAGLLWFTLGSAQPGGAASAVRVPDWQVSWRGRF